MKYLAKFYYKQILNCIQEELSWVFLAWKSPNYHRNGNNVNTLTDENCIFLYCCYRCPRDFGTSTFCGFQGSQILNTLHPISPWNVGFMSDQLLKETLLSKLCKISRIYEGNK